MEDGGGRVEGGKEREEVGGRREGKLDGVGDKVTVDSCPYKLYTCTL